MRFRIFVQAVTHTRLMVTFSNTLSLFSRYALCLFPFNYYRCRTLVSRSRASAIARCHPAVSPLQLLSSRCRLSITPLPHPSLPSCCRHIVTTMSPQCHHIVTRCHHTVTTLSPQCHPLSPHCHHNVTTMSPHCHHTVTTMSRQCHDNVTTMSPAVTSLSPHCHLTVTSRHHNVTTMSPTVTTMSPHRHQPSPQCHHNVTRCHHNVTTMSPAITTLSPHCHLTVTRLSPNSPVICRVTHGAGAVRIVAVVTAAVCTLFDEMIIPRDGALRPRSAPSRSAPQLVTARHSVSGDARDVTRTVARGDPGVRGDEGVTER